ncbi:hypothetical protein Sa4125_41700 [Aureimonas sp. SA4125]|uniref:hypothetical protein n=1 Tax=Aureimonas sp. SA4125 TaxID=2826993 RepID=UPI001CC7B50A|nr:hypothetical protein [Aureimonas sp. SA4125]BDA86628.1 hypothetical protein Sa4125_41700 [Aureimonas sp. SA4125]
MIVLLIVACAYWVELSAKEQALRNAGAQAETLAKSLAHQAGDTFQMADLALISLSRLIGENVPTRNKLQAVQADMAELLLRVPRIRALDYAERSCPSTWWKLSVAEAAPFQATSVEICSGFAVLPMAMRSAMGSVCM